MSSCRLTTLYLLVALVLIEASLSAPSSRSRTRRSTAWNSDDSLVTQDDEQSGANDWGLLDQLLTRPTKRQWCRKGLTYNHVLGSCMLSFAALRGRGKGY
ncbi:unnamed protein product [Lymnaea stagnalis]|uniref:Uncharacterized protein n=1 Tax=Lymnaea stagnalis TaxID=6523 RepID=A0AAV2HQ09_LYMST